jgi:hypothetical protein
MCHVLSQRVRDSGCAARTHVVVAFLTLVDNELKRLYQCFIFFQIADHKTSSTGPVMIALSPEVFRMVKNFIAMCKRVCSECVMCLARAVRDSGCAARTHVVVAFLTLVALRCLVTGPRFQIRCIDLLT